MTQQSDTPDPARRQAIDRLIDDIRAARLAGKEVDDATIRQSHPHLLPELAAELEKLRRIEAARRAAATAPPIPNSSDQNQIPSALLHDLETPPAIQIPGYSILREISRGGQAAVFLATQLSTGRKIALKLMHDGPFASERAISRFRREVQSLAALNHPNIVAIIDTGKTPDGARFIAMNYIPGMNLSDYMKDRLKKDPADPSKLLRLFLKICDAVNAAHRLGIIHRDLKPSNIRVDDRGEPHILDFGLARTALDRALPHPDHAVSITGEFLGSLPWSSPEQAEGDPEKIDIRTDVYSLGVILYQILTAGRFPYEVVGNIRDVLNNILTVDPTPPSKITAAKPLQAINTPPRPLPTINETIEKIVLKALAKKPALRYQSAGELGRDIARYLAGKRPDARQMQAPAISAPKRNASAYIAILVLGAIAIAVVAFIFNSRTNPKSPNPTTASVESAQAPAPAMPITPPLPDKTPTVVAPVPDHTYQPPPQTSTTFHGTLAVLFKGGTLELFLNGRRIHQSAGDDLRSIPLTLAPGDTLVLRLNSSFYYRSARAAFIDDNSSASFVLKSGDTLLQPTPGPKAPPSATPTQSLLHPSPGPHDDRQQSLWANASLPPLAEWIALPESNTSYDLFFTVPSPPH